MCPYIWFNKYYKRTSHGFATNFFNLHISPNTMYFCYGCFSMYSLYLKNVEVKLYSQITK